MAMAKFKSIISNKVLDVLKKSCGVSEINPSGIEYLLSLHASNKKENSVQLQLPSAELLNHFKSIEEKDLNGIINMKHDSAIQNIYECKNKDNESVIMFDLNKELFVGHILNDKEYFAYLKDPKIGKAKMKEKLIIEFSSPNVAKPFHMGHFRSTIIGNYLSNLYEHLSYDVVRLTYLGDWGTQFGLLQVGLNKMGMTIEEISKNPLELLFKAYVNINKESSSDPDILVQAKQIFNSMEHAVDDSVLERWKVIRQFTTEELQNIYNRLGVQFNDYDWESNYPAKRSAPIIDLLQRKNVLTNEDGKLVFRLKSGGKIAVLKSDGSSLYITRDIMAAIDRKLKYNFDKIIYVTDFSQQNHFLALNELLLAIDNNWAGKIHHVKYGRIRGMSTRKGEVVFLKDILDEARDIMVEKQKASVTTRADLDENTADVLGISAVIVNDLRHRRLRDYVFSWDTALQMKGDSGIKLQYTHCRLVSLEDNCYTELPDECDPQLLLEPEAICLVQEIARFDEVIKVSFSKQESYFLVYYLFKLCNAINSGLKVLPVKNSLPVLASQRLLLFHYARIVLNRGMKILGIKPLKKM